MPSISMPCPMPGAYGDHGPTTIGLVGHKSIPLYGGLRASRFSCDVVYTNTMGAGAYRGYGATQGIFAVESGGQRVGGRAGHGPLGDPGRTWCGKARSCRLTTMSCAEAVLWIAAWPALRR
ncbi:MAG: molybdopterin cofactor-binding domain-containing protein [Acutalibacteraceae bacterium]